eukprot:9851719-Lingulodinium_polyedra.AAC.1
MKTTTMQTTHREAEFIRCNPEYGEQQIKVELRRCAVIDVFVKGDSVCRGIVPTTAAPALVIEGMD